jgi:hypothetical protein
MAIYFHHLHKFVGLISNNFTKLGFIEKYKPSKNIHGIELSA